MTHTRTFAVIAAATLAACTSTIENGPGETDGGAAPGIVDAAPGSVDGSPGTPDAAPGEPYQVPDNQFHEVLRHGSAPAVIFRWRADGTATSAGALSDGVVVTEVQRPAPLSVFRYATFDGVASGATPGYVGDAPITTQVSGITVQAWFRAHDVAGIRTLFSNTGSNKGFSLDLRDGHLSLVFSTDDNGTAHRTTVIDEGDPIPTGKWLHAAGAIARTGDGFRVRLFLDEVLVHQQMVDLTHGNELFNVSELPTVGAEPTSGAPDGEGFDGDLHAVVVHNYQIDRDVLAAPVLRDGGRYFGEPSYHDYLTVPEPDGTSGASPPYSDRKWNLARRIVNTDRDARFTGLVRTRARLGLPLLNDRFVPGGVAVSADGETMWLGYHYLSTDGANPDGHASVVAEVDLPSRTVTRLLRLEDASGAPVTWSIDGLAAAHGYLYVARDRLVYRFQPSAATPAEAAVADTPGSPAIFRLPVLDSFPVATPGTGISYDAELDSLWIVRTHQATDPPEAGTLDRYALAAGGALARPSAATSDDRVLLPTAIHLARGAIRVPGAAIAGTRAGTDPGESCFLVSTSGETSVAASASEVRYFCTDAAASVARARLSAGARGITLGPDGTVWVASASGAAVVQKRTNAAQWYDSLTPYVVGFALAELTPLRESCEEGDLLPYVGDIHTHTSYSDGSDYPADMFATAQATGLDYIAVTDHASKLTDAEFASCRAAAADVTVPGTFLGFCGFETQTFVDGVGYGHANTLFWDDYFVNPTSVAQLYQRMDACSGDGCLGQFNHPASVNYPFRDRTRSASADVDMSLCELNGASTDTAFLAYVDFLDRGWHVGPSWNSDTHSLVPGNGGKRTGVWLSSLDLETLRLGLYAGRTFGSNAGNQASLELKAEGCWMGATLRGYLRASFSVLATDGGTGFTRIELFAEGGALVRTIACNGELTCGEDVVLDLDPAELRYLFARAIRTDGKWLVSAPVWVAE